MRSIVIEDQAPAQRILQKYINDTAGLELERTFCDALEASTYLKDHPIDLVFLDISLPRFSGMDFLRAEKSCPPTILTTAYSEFALESYQFNVVDYLLKPFSFERFSQAIDKAISMTGLTKATGDAQAPAADRHLYIKSSHDLVKVDPVDIIFIKSDSDYTEVITPSQNILSGDPLRDWMTKLDGNFKQAHKSYIVNTSHLLKISHNRVYLPQGHVIPIGRAFKKQLMEDLVKPS